MTTFNASYLEEQNLIFGNQQEEKDPRLGLCYYGPYHHSSEVQPLSNIRIGLIGNKSTIEKTKRIIAMLANKIDSPSSNKWLYPHYPGMSSTTSFKCAMQMPDNLQETITDHEIKAILDIADVNERIGAATELYIKKFENILAEDDPPHVVICALPEEIEAHCGISEHTRGAKTPTPTELEKQINKFKEQNQRFLDEWGLIVKAKKPTIAKGYDFRNALKGRIMRVTNTAPIQILKESTCDQMINYTTLVKHKGQDPASFAWNFSTALYYKANGKPWRLAKLRQDTCYVGISFYRNKHSANQNIETAMAQVFTHSGDGLVLRGTDVIIEEGKKEPHLSEKQAEELMKDILAKYNTKAGRPPARVVIHKSTLFSKEEEAGFSKAIGNMKKDFVTIKMNHGFRFLRWGAYPVLRGTLITLTKNQYLLYTAGYTPRIRTYPGHSIPQPLLLAHSGDSEATEISKEILGLTKLNWNTTSFSTNMPITLAFAGKVGKVLSELDKSQPVQDHYRFYM